MPRQARPWFRFYSEQLESRKAQALRREDPFAFGIWIGLLCIANIAKTRGTLPPIDDIVFAFRPDPDEQVRLAVEVLQTRRFIDKKRAGLVMHNWEDWQRDSDAYKSPGRQNRHEEGTESERGRNAVGTHKPGGRNAVGTHREEEEVEEEREKEERERRPRAARHANPIDQLVADFAQIGRTNSATVGDIDDAVEHHGLEKVQLAVKKARASGKDDLPWSYVDSILEGGSLDEPKRNGRLSTPEAADSGVSAEHERLGLGQPARMVANPFVQRDANGRALKAVDAGGVGNG